MREDVTLWCRLSLAGCIYKMIPEYVYLHKYGVSHSPWLVNITNIIIIFFDKNVEEAIASNF